MNMRGGNGGPHSGHKDVSLGQDVSRFLLEPIVVHLKRGLIENFYVSQDEPVSVTNIKRSLLAQLQLDVTGSQRIAADIPQMGVKSTQEVTIRTPTPFRNTRWFQ